MGSRRCCCGIVKVESCKSCCGNCISAHKIEDEYGNHTFANQAPEDKIILHQGAGYSPGGELKQVNADAIIKVEYLNIGSYWTFWHPAFMANFDPTFPACTNMQGTPGCGEGGVVNGSNYIKNGTLDNRPIDRNGLRSLPNNRGPSIEQQNLQDELSNNAYLNFHVDGLGGLIGPPRFSTIFQNDPYECRDTVNCPGDYGCPASMNVYYNQGPTVSYNHNGGPLTFRFGYPCSTVQEDFCCEYGASICPGSPLISLLPYEGQNGRNLFAPYNSNSAGPSNTNTNACNFLSLTRYQRRLFRTYYPWAWQVFSYNMDHLIPFGNAFKSWATVTSAEGESTFQLVDHGALMPVHESSPNDVFEPTGGIYYSLSSSSQHYWTFAGSTPVNPCLSSGGEFVLTSTRASTLRQQFLGFAFCEHHYDPSCGTQEVKVSDFNYEAPISRWIPRRFVYACSGIPIFEFDLWEATKSSDEITGINDAAITETDKDALIEAWKSFTMWYKNPKNNLESYNSLDGELPPLSLGSPDYSATPTVEQAETGRNLLAKLSDQNYSGVQVRDWRSEAYDEISKANDIYRDCIRATYILRNYKDATKTPTQIKTEAQEYANTVFDLGALLFGIPIDELKLNKSKYLSVVFPSQLGPVRKRCRQNNPARRTQGQADWNDSNPNTYVTRKSVYGMNVLLPKYIYPNDTNQRVINFGSVSNYNSLNNLRVDNSSSDLIETAWKYQSLAYADISAYLFNSTEGMPNPSLTDQVPEEDVWDGTGSPNGKWVRDDTVDGDEDSYGYRYSEFDVHVDMVNRISHLCYTYFFTQPAGWDFVTWGPLPNGPLPQNNWWFRRYGTIAFREENYVNYFSLVNRHSQLPGCGETTALSNWEYAWNPSKNGLRVDRCI
jgi:hypothetical protein